MKNKKNKTSLKTSNRVSVDVNDVFEEITDQNKELREQIKLFVEFKQFFDKIIDKLKSYLNDFELSELKTFDNKLNQFFGSDITLNEKIDEKVESDCLKIAKTNGFHCKDNESDDTNDEDFKPTLRTKSRLKTQKMKPNKTLKDKIVNKSKRLLNENKSQCESNNIENDVKPKKARKYVLKKRRKDLNKVCEQCGKVFSRRIGYLAHRYEIHRLFDDKCRRTVYRCDWPGCDFISIRMDRYNQHVNNHQGSLLIYYFKIF